MSVVVVPQDPRYETLSRGHNLRWPEDGHDAAGRIYLCESVGEVAEALQQTISAGLRPTVRSGAHCYEDFVVNNPGGVIFDLSLLTGTYRQEGQSAIRLAPGTQLWGAYTDLYKRYGSTIPAGALVQIGMSGRLE